MIIGHHRQINYLSRVLKRGTLAHAYLFHGPDAVGKKTAALALAKSLLCSGSAPLEARPVTTSCNGARAGGAAVPTSRRDLPLTGFGGCGQCGDCRQVEALAHPDLIFLSLDRMLVEEENKREIGIKNIHELQRILGLSAWGGGWRIAVIDGAEHLSREAQSALLKKLEEPARRTVFFLITGAAEVLWPTIRSRCVLLGFSTLRDDEMRPSLAGIPVGRHSLFLSLAQGRPGVLMQLMRDKAFLDEFRARRERFEKLLRLDLNQQFLFSEKEAREPGGLESFLEFLLRKFYQDFHPARGKSRRDVGTAAPSARAAFLKMLLEKLAISRAMPVNRRLLADSVFFDLNMLEAK